MKQSNLFICSVIFYLLSITDAVNFRDCGSNGINVKKVKIHPCKGDPCILEAGMSISVSINFKAFASVEVGSSTIRATIENVSVLGLLTPKGTCAHLSPSCPIQAGGFYTYSQATEIPADIQTGPMNVRWEILLLNGGTFLCVDFPVEIADLSR
ncbi:hypothetical protein CRM22_003381 [Opisthorchis felineus]|nr:hypothetical protein CRM22_003381 [Opisthorchis felineus]